MFSHRSASYLHGFKLLSSICTCFHMAMRGICMASNRSRESWMVFARVFTWLCDVVLQVHHLNTQNLRFPVVLLKKIGVMLMQFLHVFSYVLWRFEPFFASSGFSIRCGFWFSYVFRMFFAVCWEGSIWYTLRAEFMPVLKYGFSRGFLTLGDSLCVFSCVFVLLAGWAGWLAGWLAGLAIWTYFQMVV